MPTVHNIGPPYIKVPDMIGRWHSIVCGGVGLGKISIRCRPQKPLRAASLWSPLGPPRHTHTHTHTRTSPFAGERAERVFVWVRGCVGGVGSGGVSGGVRDAVPQARRPALHRGVISPLGDAIPQQENLWVLLRLGLGPLFIDVPCMSKGRAMCNREGVVGEGWGYKGGRGIGARRRGGQAANVA